MKIPYGYRSALGFFLMGGGFMLMMHHFIFYGEINFDIIGHETYAIISIIVGFLLCFRKKKNG